VAKNVRKGILENIGREDQEQNWVVEPGIRRLCHDIGLISFVRDSEKEGNKNII
jgi:hypothetical protein